MLPCPDDRVVHPDGRFLSSDGLRWPQMASPCAQPNGASTRLTRPMSLSTCPMGVRAPPRRPPGLSPAVFTLHTVLENATLVDGDRVLTRADEGTGYVCCGAVKSYVVPDVPRSHAVAVQLNLTRGMCMLHVECACACAMCMCMFHVAVQLNLTRGIHGRWTRRTAYQPPTSPQSRAHGHRPPSFATLFSAGAVRVLFVKHGSCASSLTDVDGATCGSSACEISWLTVYDEFYGHMLHTYSTYLAVPFGPEPWRYNPETTSRREGDWCASLPPPREARHAHTCTCTRARACALVHVHVHARDGCARWVCTVDVHGSCTWGTRMRIRPSTSGHGHARAWACASVRPPRAPASRRTAAPPPSLPARRGRYVSVEALPGVDAEYELGLTLLEPPREPEVYACSRFAGFCPKKSFHKGLSFVEVTEVSAAGAGAAPSARLAVGLCTLVLALPTLRRRARRRASTSRGKVPRAR